MGNILLLLPRHLIFRSLGITMTTNFCNLLSEIEIPREPRHVSFVTRLLKRAPAQADSRSTHPSARWDPKQRGCRTANRLWWPGYTSLWKLQTPSSEMPGRRPRL